MSEHPLGTSAEDIERIATALERIADSLESLDEKGIVIWER
jgi:hypothetical protein